MTQLTVNNRGLTINSADSFKHSAAIGRCEHEIDVLKVLGPGEDVVPYISNQAKLGYLLRVRPDLVPSPDSSLHSIGEIFNHSYKCLDNFSSHYIHLLFRSFEDGGYSCT